MTTNLENLPDEKLLTLLNMANGNPSLKELRTAGSAEIGMRAGTRRDRIVKFLLGKGFIIHKEAEGNFSGVFLKWFSATYPEPIYLGVYPSFSSIAIGTILYNVSLEDGDGITVKGPLNAFDVACRMVNDALRIQQEYVDASYES